MTRQQQPFVFFIQQPYLDGLQPQVRLEHEGLRAVVEVSLVDDHDAEEFEHPDVEEDAGRDRGSALERDWVQRGVDGHVEALGAQE